MLAGTAWSFAKMLWNDSPLLAALSTEVLRHLHAFEPKDLANTAWSWARMLLLDLPLFDAISASARDKIS